MRRGGEASENARLTGVGGTITKTGNALYGVVEGRALVPERLPSAASQSSCNSSISVVVVTPPPPRLLLLLLLLCAKYPGCPSNGTGALLSSSRSLAGSDAGSSESSRKVRALGTGLLRAPPPPPGENASRPFTGGGSVVTFFSTRVNGMSSPWSPAGPTSWFSSSEDVDIDATASADLDTLHPMVVVVWWWWCR